MRLFIILVADERGDPFFRLKNALSRSFASAVGCGERFGVLASGLILCLDVAIKDFERSSKVRECRFGGQAPGGVARIVDRQDQERIALIPEKPFRIIV